jgi:glycosyltransferase involved in cell wall biosynthesis
MTELFQRTSTEFIGAKETPLVSIIITNYNYGCFLPQAIESVLNQTYQNFELIVVDDGSTDNSQEVIKSYGERLISIFQENGGQGEAFNAGISKSQGEIICFLDADDYFHEDKLAKVVAGFLDHPDWVQISHGRISVNREGLALGCGPRTYSEGDVRDLLLQWGRYAMGITSSLAYRRAALQQVLPIPTTRFEVEGRYFTESADTYLTMTIPFYGAVGCINEPLMFYRMHGNNVRAHSDNLPYLIREHEGIATYINQTAAKVGLIERFSIQRDVDYRSLKAIQQGSLRWAEALEIIWLSLRESLAIKRSPKDALERLLRRGICALFPSEGKSVLRLGLRSYLRFKLLRQESKK